MLSKIAGQFIYVWDFLFPATYQSNVKLNGKTVVITGGNTGIGKETARDLAERGAKVIISCRDIKKGREAAEEIRQEIKDANVIVKQLDLASFSSIQQFAQEIQRSEPQINILINNAGVAVCPKSKTTDGFELQFGVNHLGHFLLTNLLMDKIKASAPARIVNVASAAHFIGDINFGDINMEKNYNALMAYCNSKLANILFTRELAKKLEGTGVSTYSLHPGCVHTELSRNISSVNGIIGSIYDFVMKLTFMSARKGASTTIYCAVEESLASESGLYYTACRSVQPSTTATDDALAKKLWEFSEDLIASVK
ncbi:hypothetical protein TNIN_149071 [Trichonephila inaurata madagascariensis]|uniref:Retinol dehydrogenase 11 n=1 Tax=Trichonephila inaurata madagascariensis TaxID=2747483 RepID=A0A8X6Y4Z4_9ARAC|nr:hypothetical protein TNIN_149071 [Trichonephila inaurata madagascariensis]